MPDDCQPWDHLWKVELWRIVEQSGGSHADYVDGIYLSTDDASFETYDGLAWSPDSSLLAITTGTAMSRHDPEFADHGCGQSEPGIIIVRSEASGGLSCIANLTGPTRPVTTVDWSSDGEKIVIGCQDGTIRIWTISFGNEDTQIIGNSHEYVLLLPALSVLYCLTRMKHRNKR